MLQRQMQYFVSVVDCGSFTEAAEQNYISQSAISQQIQALEQELGVLLLVRENRKFHVTTAGDYFYRHARELLRDMESMKNETIRLPLLAHQAPVNHLLHNHKQIPTQKKTKFLWSFLQN